MSIDPSTIPDDVLKSEMARRNAAKRQTFGGGRPVKEYKCGECRKTITGSIAFRKHKASHKGGRAGERKG